MLKNTLTILNVMFKLLKHFIKYNKQIYPLFFPIYSVYVSAEIKIQNHANSVAPQPQHMSWISGSGGSTSFPTILLSSFLIHSCIPACVRFCNIFSNPLHRLNRRIAPFLNESCRRKPTWRLSAYGNRA